MYVCNSGKTGYLTWVVIKNNVKYPSETAFQNNHTKW
jgi:hypothetical protein